MNRAVERRGGWGGRTRGFEFMSFLSFMGFLGREPVVSISSLRVHGQLPCQRALHQSYDQRRALRVIHSLVCLYRRSSEPFGGVR